MNFKIDFSKIGCVPRGLIEQLVVEHCLALQYYYKPMPILPVCLHTCTPARIETIPRRVITHSIWCSALERIPVEKYEMGRAIRQQIEFGVTCDALIDLCSDLTMAFTDFGDGPNPFIPLAELWILGCVPRGEIKGEFVVFADGRSIEK